MCFYLEDWNCNFQYSKADNNKLHIFTMHSGYIEEEEEDFA